MNEAANFCPICGTRLNPDNISAGKCPSCGQSLPGAQPTEGPAPGPSAGPQEESGPQPPGMPPRAPQPPPGAVGYGPAMAPPPPPAGSAGFGGQAAVKRNNVVGVIALICSLLSLLMVPVGLYCSAKISPVIAEETTKVMEREKRGEFTMADWQKIMNAAAPRLERDFPVETMLANLLCLGCTLGLVGGILGIVGLVMRGRKKGAAATALILGIITAIGGLIAYVVVFMGAALNTVNQYHS